KIAIPTGILNKSGPLSPQEFELIKTHCAIGRDMVAGIDFPWPVAAMIHQHHERIDGSGYPQGLTGDQMVPEARILAVADVMEAMCAHRPYRPALGEEKALAEIEKRRGTAFDPEAVDACLRLFREKGFRFDSDPA
ncbi:MAG: HD-GYP domain-containing protein, partial [Thiohalorhabdaceae bacterium]